MMQKRYVLCGLLFIAGQPLANAFPVLDSVVPNGWKQVATASGDLNKDGTDDDVVVLEQLDPANLKANDGPGVPVLNLNPRRLLVMFKTAEGYQQVLGRDDLLPSEHDADSPCVGQHQHKQQA